ncbi:MAG: dTDP-glucose 4,6-dehydratase [Planctomycetes bacterium GWF2_50_10]|nr:MAG: dTDP-glucose 4,6-dehydratase [Planctomycetes bacterium GWF2_50_10]
MKILVTGGAGFIGANFVRMVLDEHKDVSLVNLDKLTYAGNLENLTGYLDRPNHTFVKGDICDVDLVKKLLDEHSIDRIVNFAAESHVDRSIISHAEFVRTNVEGTLSLLQAARDRNIERFLQVSTDEVYGSLGPQGQFTENSVIEPNSPYSASKASADHFVRAFGHTFGLRYNITRCSNNYGPYQFPEKMIPLMIHNAMHDKPLPVYGDGLNVRDWLYVYDHCTAIWAVLTKSRPGEVYNIGGCNEKTNLDVVSLILDQLKKPKSLISFVKDRPGHDRRYAIDASKTMNQLGWKPSITFEQGIVRTIQWYCDNRDWLANVASGDYKHYYEMMYSRR